MSFTFKLLDIQTLPSAKTAKILFMDMVFKPLNINLAFGKNMIGKNIWISIDLSVISKLKFLSKMLLNQEFKRRIEDTLYSSAISVLGCE